MQQVDLGLLGSGTHIRRIHSTRLSDSGSGIPMASRGQHLLLLLLLPLLGLLLSLIVI
jgi:hypothetical protein